MIVRMMKLMLMSEGDEEYLGNLSKIWNYNENIISCKTLQ